MQYPEYCLKACLPCGWNRTTIRKKVKRVVLLQFNSQIVVIDPDVEAAKLEQAKLDEMGKQAAEQARAFKAKQAVESLRLVKERKKKINGTNMKDGTKDRKKDNTMQEAEDEEDCPICCDALPKLSNRFVRL